MGLGARGPFELKWERIHEAVLGREDAGRLMSAANRRLFDRWAQAGAEGGPVPRDVFDIMDLRGLLGDLCVHDYDADRADFRCRVFGASLVADFGMDMTGRYFADHTASTREVVRAQYGRVMSTGRPLVAAYRAVKWEPGAPPLEVGRFLHEKIVLPVTRDGRSLDCFISHVARLPFDAASPPSAA